MIDTILLYFIVTVIGLFFVAPFFVVVNTYVKNILDRHRYGMDFYEHIFHWFFMITAFVIAFIAVNGVCYFYSYYGWEDRHPCIATVEQKTFHPSVGVYRQSGKSQIYVGQSEAYYSIDQVCSKRKDTDSVSKPY